MYTFKAYQAKHIKQNIYIYETRDPKELNIKQ